MTIALKIDISKKIMLAIDKRQGQVDYYNLPLPLYVIAGDQFLDSFFLLRVISARISKI